jgi:hypothetical protein
MFTTVFAARFGRPYPPMPHPAAKFTPEEYARRHRCVLLHTGRYRIIVPPCVTRTFGFGKALPQVYTRLVKDGLLSGYPRVLPGGASCYTLTAAGCRDVNAPQVRAVLPEGSALDLSIAVSFFCHLGTKRRYRIEAEQASQLLGTPMPTNLAYVVTSEVNGETSLLRCVSAASLTAAELVRTLRTLVEQTRRHSLLPAWMDAQQYGMAVLCPTPQQLVESEKAVTKSRIREACVVVTGLGPTAETLSAALKFKGK